MWTLSDTSELLLAIGEDIDEAYGLLQATNRSAFGRRVYVRVLFAQIEAWVYNVKQFIVASAPAAARPLTCEELALLREVSFELSDQGVPNVKPGRFVPLDRNLRFLFHLTDRVYSTGIALDTAGHDWQQFQRSLKLRHRLTHPKSSAELLVSDDDLRDALGTQQWFQRVSLQLVRHIFQPPPRPGAA